MIDRDRRLWHRIKHLLGWNTGTIETWWEGEHLMVGFKCSCGKMQGVVQTTIRRNLAVTFSGVPRGGEMSSLDGYRFSGGGKMRHTTRGFKPNREGDSLGAILEREVELKALRAEVERLRMQLAACGVAAMCNTKEATEKQRIGKDSPYYSASYQDVCDAVDREMALRTRLEQAEGKVERVIRIINDPMVCEYQQMRNRIQEALRGEP